MGAFDDLIPKAKDTPAPSRKGAFEDLVPKPEQPGMATSAARSAVQGLTFGLADESYGLMQGIGGMISGEGFGTAYDRAVKDYRARDKEARSANPISSTVGEIAGGMATGLGLAGSGATLMRQGMALPQAMAAGAGEGALYGAAYGAGNAEGGLSERLDGARSGALTGAAVGGAVPLVARGIGALTSRAITPMTIPPERQAAIAALEREGVPLSAGQRTGSTPLRYAESIFGDAPLAGGKASALMEAQGEAFTDAAMRRVGASGRATPDNVSAVRDRIGKTFNDLSARNVVQADRQVGRELGQTLREYDIVLPPDQKKIVGDLAASIVERYQAHNGALPGRDYQTIRSRLSRVAQSNRIKDPDFADAIRGLRDALDNNMARSIAPDDAKAWQQARREWGNLKVIERAGSAAGENAAAGLISPQQLRIAASQGAGNRAGYARGEGDFAELARAGNVAMTPLPNSGTGQRNMMAGQVGGGGASLATGDPLMAAIIGLGPSVFGRALWSGPVQQYLSNQAITPAARMAIEARIRAALQGGAQSQTPRLSAPAGPGVPVP